MSILIVISFSNQIIVSLSPQVQKEVNKTAAELASWSIKWAMSGKAPDVGFRGEALTGDRLARKGQPLSKGWRLMGGRSESKHVERNSVSTCQNCFISFKV